MIISTVSRGSWAAGDGHVVKVCGEGLVDHIFRVTAGVRYQTRLVRSSITAAVIVVRQNDEEWVVWLPDNEDVGVFVGGIVFLPLEVEVGSNHREKTFPGFRLARGSTRSAASSECASQTTVPPLASSDIHERAQTSTGYAVAFAGSESLRLRLPRMIHDMRRCSFLPHYIRLVPLSLDRSSICQKQSPREHN